MERIIMAQIEEMRLDKWLWAARFFKTRALAQKHIELGRIKVNGDKVKNSKIIQKGDVIDLQLNHLPYRLTVIGLNMQRRPAPEARQLYHEDEQTVLKREEISQLNKSIQILGNYPEGRPTKRDRRQIDKLKRMW